MKQVSSLDILGEIKFIYYIFCDTDFFFLIFTFLFLHLTF